MSFLEFLAGFSPSKWISDWRHENTVREQNRLQSDIEIQKIEVEKKRVEVEYKKLEVTREDADREAELESRRIQMADQQQQRQIELEREKARLELVGLLIKEDLLPKSAVKDILVSLSGISNQSASAGKQQYFAGNSSSLLLESASSTPAGSSKDE